MFDNTEGEDYYYSLKERYTVDGLVDKRGHEVERYTYDAYGRPVIRSIPREDVDYSGTVTPLDEWAINTRISQAVCDYGPIYDLDDDGDLDRDDVDVADGAGVIRVWHGVECERSLAVGLAGRRPRGGGAVGGAAGLLLGGRAARSAAFVLSVFAAGGAAGDVGDGGRGDRRRRDLRGLAGDGWACGAG